MHEWEKRVTVSQLAQSLHVLCCGKLFFHNLGVFPQGAVENTAVLFSNDPADQFGNCHNKYWLLCYTMKYRKSSEFFHSLVENYWQKMAGLGGTWAPVVSPAHQQGHHTRKRTICQVSYDTHARCIIHDANRRVWCILPACLRARSIRPAWCGGLRCILPASPMHIYRSPWCIRTAAVMHKYLAVLRHLMGHFAVLRNKLLRFLSIMLTFMRFHGRLHAKMTINSLIKVFHNFFHSLI